MPDTSVTSPFEGARWIWGGHSHYDLHNSYVLIRKSFEVPSLPVVAPLFITADQSYHLYLNHHFIGRGPARGYQASWPYDEWDVAPFLRAGTNVLAVRAHHPGVSTFSYVSEHMAGVLVSGHWELGQQKFLLQSGPDWKGWRQTSVRKDTVPASLQLFPQEHIDLREEPQGWMEPDFDDELWSVTALNAWNSPPWHTLEARGIPPLRESSLLPQAVVAVAEGQSVLDFRDARDVVAVARLEGLEHRTVYTNFVGALQVEASGIGRFRSIVIDFGRVVVGNLELSIEGARGGETVDALYCEVTHEDDAGAPTQTPWHEPDSYCFIAIGSRLVCRPGRNTHSFHHINGFRFLTLRVRDSLGELRLTPRLRTVGYPVERQGEFHSSETLLGHIWEACAHTQEICSLDAYVDTPWREQAQWWGDARVQAWNTFHLCDDARLLRRGIKQIGTQQLPNGLTYGHAPTIAHTCVLPDFTLVWILTQWDYFWQTGSLEAFQSHRETTERALNYFRAQTDGDKGLVKSDVRYWLFLDWTCLPKEGISSVLNCWLVLALEKLAQMHRLCGEDEAAQSAEEWAASVRESLEKLIVQGLLRDGYGTQAAPHETASAHAQTLALMLGLRGLDEEKAVQEVLLPLMALNELPDQEHVILPSAYWVTYVFSILSERGHGGEVVRFIQRHWEPMARFGSTWESYAGRLEGGSRSHAWSAHPLFHLMQTIGGLTQTAPQWEKVRFSPVFTGEYGGATIPTPQGVLKSHWEKSGGCIEVSLVVPEGIEAHVHLPGIEAIHSTGTYQWIV